MKLSKIVLSSIIEDNDKKSGQNLPKKGASGYATDMISMTKNIVP